jgi:hypothetical protein
LPSTPQRSLTPAERETVILMDDASDVAIVSTHWRRVVTRLERNPLAVKTAGLTYGTTGDARFEIPTWSVSFRRKPRKASNHPRNTAGLVRRVHEYDAGAQDAT